MRDEDDYVRIATLGAAHGLRGDVRLRLHTDDPDARLVVGARFVTDPPEVGPVELDAVSQRSGGTYARFVGHTDRTAAQALRGVVLLAPRNVDDDPDAWYPEQLTGLQARNTTGAVLGTIAGVQHLPAQDVLVLAETGGARTLVPFVTAIVPTVDVAGGYVVIDPPSGLLAGEAAEEAR